MEIKTTAGFLSYYEKTREGTHKILQVIPHDALDFSYKTGKFTVGDLVRHIAAIERNVFAQLVVGNSPTYKGCGKELADGYENVMAYFEEMHRQSMQIFGALSNEDLAKKIKSLNQQEVSIAIFLRALVIHEVHHRGALCIYLNLLGVATPPIMNLTAEQVIQLSK